MGFYAEVPANASQGGVPTRERYRRETLKRNRASSQPSPPNVETSALPTPCPRDNTEMLADAGRCRLSAKTRQRREHDADLGGPRPLADYVSTFRREEGRTAISL